MQLDYHLALSPQLRESLEVYRREQASLRLIATVLSNDELTLPLLPGFSCSVAQIFS